MGFLKYLAIYILGLAVITIAGCTKPLILKNIIADKPGHFMYGGSPERNFYVPEVISDSLEFNWIAETEKNIRVERVQKTDTRFGTVPVNGKSAEEAGVR